MSSDKTMSPTDWAAKADELSDPNPLADLEAPAPPAEVAVLRPPPPVQVRRPNRTEKAAPAGSTPAERAGFVWRKKGYFRGVLDGLIPTAERCKVWKRDDKGNLHYISAYSPQDLDRCHDIEDFLQTYLQPKYGPGDYEVALVAADGSPTRAIAVHLAETLPSAPAAAPLPAVPAAIGGEPQVLQLLLNRINQLEANPPKPPPTLTEQLQELEALKKTLGFAGDKPADPGMMMMLLQKLGGGDTGAAEAHRRELADLRAEVAALARGGQNAGPLALPPDQGFTLHDVAQLLDRSKGEQLGVKDVVALMEAMRPKEAPKVETFGIKDFIGLMPTVLGLIDKMQAPTRAAVEQMAEAIEKIGEDKERKGGLRGLLEDMKTVKELVGLQKADTDSFGGFLAQAFANFPEKLDAIGNLVERIANAEKSTKTEKTEHRAEEKKEPAKKASPADAFPPGFKELVAAIGKAETDAARIGATLHAFKALAALPKFRPALVQAVAFAQAGNQEKILELLTAVLEGMGTHPALADVLPSEARSATVAAFKANLDEVMKAIANKLE